MPKWLYFTITGVSAAALSAGLTYYLQRRHYLNRLALRAPVEEQEDLEILRCLGTGAGGAAFLVRCHEADGERLVVKVTPQRGKDVQAFTAMVERLRSALADYPPDHTVQWVRPRGVRTVRHAGNTYLLQLLGFVRGPTLWRLFRRRQIHQVPPCFIAEWARDAVRQWNWQEERGVALTNIVLRNFIVGADGVLYRHDFDPLRPELTDKLRWRGRYRALRLAHELVRHLAERRSRRRNPIPPRAEEICRRAGDFMPHLDLVRRVLNKIDKKNTPTERQELLARFATMYEVWCQELADIAALWPSAELRRLDPEGVLTHYLPRRLWR